MERWETVAEKYRSSGTIPGDEIFKLHDTFGFHVELTRELAKDKELALDMEGYERAMREQRERSKSSSEFRIPSSEFSKLETPPSRNSPPQDQQFCGYDWTDRNHDRAYAGAFRFIEQAGRAGYGKPETRIPNPVSQVGGRPRKGAVLCRGWGQVGDTGTILGEDFELEVLDTSYSQLLRVCRVKVISGTPKAGAKVKALVDTRRRREIERAHTATPPAACRLARYRLRRLRQAGRFAGSNRAVCVSTSPPCSRSPTSRSPKSSTSSTTGYRGIAVDQMRDLPIDDARKLGALAFSARITASG